MFRMFRCVLTFQEEELHLTHGTTLLRKRIMTQTFQILITESAPPEIS